MPLSDKKYLVVTYWGYPFGGGEAFMYQSLKWATLDLNMQSFWLCFCGADNKPYDQFVVEKHPFGTLIKVTGGFSEANLERWMRVIQPDVVHHQGHKRMEIMSICSKLRVCFVTGYHFWHGAVCLGEPTSNQNILKFAENHSKDPLLDQVLLKAQGVYVASKFMVDVFEKVCHVPIKDVIYPIPDVNHCTYSHYEPSLSRCVTQVNIHLHKGGKLFLALCKALPNIPFLAVRTELFSEELDAEIETELKTRSGGGTYMQRVEDVRQIYSETRVCLVPSLCDETFCRVALEAMQNGIPVVTTGRGNIANIVGDSGFVLDFDGDFPQDISPWVEAVQRLCTDDTFYLEKSLATRNKAKEFDEKIVSNAFATLVRSSYLKGCSTKIGLFAPWCDQGLGIQCRAYRDLLCKLGFEIHIFSFLPYWNVKEKDRHQKNPIEWLHPPENNAHTEKPGQGWRVGSLMNAENVSGGSVFYSDYTREEVTDEEIVDFVKRTRITKAIIPETCWPRIFQVAHLLQTLNVQVYAVPNIEIVRRDEMHLHRYFHKILCNNYICKETFEQRGFSNCQYLGYSLPPPENIMLSRKPFGPEITFVCLGGMNAFTRKQMVEVCQGFALACSRLPTDSLIQPKLFACIQGKWDERMDEFFDHPNIVLIREHLSYARICQFYMEEHVNIQVSKHEGLGLGFYEALSFGMPCLTLDAAPHNEIVIDGQNGWVLPCTFKPMLDNNCGFMESAYFKIEDFAAKILNIVQNIPELEKLHAQVLPHFKKNYNIHNYKSRWLECLKD
jgi:glycosyltransferase involved in cell wall biosynthesis